MTPELMSILESSLQKVQIPSSHDNIYKEECMYSFDSPESEGGLFVCLNRFWGLGRQQVERYSQKAGNSVFLHIRKIKHKKTINTDVIKEGPDKKVTKLAIGVEGGFADTPQNEYSVEEHLNLAILPWFHLIPLPNEQLPEKILKSIAGIIAAESVTKKAELEALAGTWDGEIRKVSKHAENLLQLEATRKIPPRGWRCEIEGCNMVENLWLNLTDGSILCGRKFFDGSGGNNHAVEHYAQIRYPLAVKLGTISSEGKADVFSYEEDEMVEDPKLVQHLAHWGINVSQMEKTDKSMLEMEIDLNQKMEWNTIQEMGAKLIPINGPEFTGMVNMGNTCYLNSIMQVLLTIPNFRQRFINNAQKYFDTSDDPANDINVQISKLCLGLTSGKYSKSTDDDDSCQNGVIPIMFKYLIGKGHAEFSSKKQQDAQEFFLHIVNILARISRNEENPADCFKFKVEDKVKCDASGQVRYTHRIEYCLPLPIPIESAINSNLVKEYEEKKLAAQKENLIFQEEVIRPIIPIETCIESFISPETLDCFYSTAVKKTVTASKFTRLATFPDYLVIQLKKFMMDLDWTPKKLDVSLNMPFELDLSALKAKGLQSYEVLLPEYVEDGGTGSKPKSVEINEEVVNQLVEMGFNPNACRRAAISTGNQGIEASMNWIMDNMDDPSINDPVNIPNTGSSASAQATSFVADQGAMEQIMMMGFSTDEAMKALQATNNNVERAIDWIFSHAGSSGPSGEMEISEPVDEKLSDGSPKYKLFAFVSHMGPSTMCGHYVCHILKDGKWTIFNDDKVALSEKLPNDLGYLYFYKRSQD